MKTWRQLAKFDGRKAQAGQGGKYLYCLFVWHNGNKSTYLVQHSGDGLRWQTTCAYAFRHGTF